MRMAICICALLHLLATASGQNIMKSELNVNCRCKATLIDSLVSEFKKQTTSTFTDNRISNVSINPQERVTFLNADFATRSFTRACEVKCVEFITSNGVHLGIVDIGLNNGDKKKCIQAIKASQRSNFKTKVLTHFKLVERKDEVVIVYSETLGKDEVKGFFDKLR